jgi:sugar O-acyltransferase (sialic acid O-acetyltransferase NeuD family)
MNRPLIVLGTGGNALDILDVVEAINRVSPTWHLAGFLDDARPVGSRFHGYPVLGPLLAARDHARALFVNAIGSDRSYRRRPAIVESTGLPDAAFATLVHPTAGVSSRSRLGVGTVVNAGASVGGEVEIGRHVTVGPNATIGHNAVVEDFTMIAPAAVVSGFVRVGRGAYLGAGSKVKQQVAIGESALVGLGAVVVRDVEAGSVVVGNPARPLVKPVVVMGSK